MLTLPSKKRSRLQILDLFMPLHYQSFHKSNAIEQATVAILNSAGNFYINDKPTGAVGGQLPFGGAHRSGINDKSGSMINLLRWVSPHTIKETFKPTTVIRFCNRDKLFD